MRLNKFKFHIPRLRTHEGAPFARDNAGTGSAP
jgi:hypothetical protein